jgi:valyl-tRNA synthetase
MINLQEERTRLAQGTSKVEEELARVQKKLSTLNFYLRRRKVIQKEREKSIQHEEKLRALNLSLERLREIE